MNWIQNAPLFAIMLSMLCAIVSSVLHGRAAKWVSYTLCAVNTTLMALLVVYFIRNEMSYVYPMGHFPAPWGNELRAGPLEAMIGLLVSGVMLLSLAGGVRHIQADINPGKANYYYVMADLLSGSLLALIFTNDIFTSYVFIEITTIASCGLLMIREIGRTTVAATRYMLFSLLGSGLFLIGITLLYDLTGHLLMEYMQSSIAVLAETPSNRIPLLVSVGLITVGLSLKSGLFPFHFWMPDTYAYATPASGSILSGLVSKGYIFILIKIYYRVVGIEWIAQSGILNILFIFGLCGMLVGSFGAIKETEIRRMIAYSSAAQTGYIFAGIGLGTTAGTVAALFHFFAHAVTAPLLFISAAGLSDVSDGSKQFAALQGAGHRNRLAGFAFSVGAMSMVGLPMLAGFITKLLFASAAMQSPRKMLPLLIVLAISTVLNALYYLRTMIRIYRPSSIEYDAAVIYRQRELTVVLFCFIALCFYLGLFSAQITTVFESGLRFFV